MADHEVRGMFETTASTYDVQNRMLSLGRDRHWRRIFVRRLRVAPGSLVGDMCVGTGEIALAVCRRNPDARVVGVDFSPGMMRVARRKIRAAGLEDRIELRRGDLRSLPLPDGLFDAVTMSFGIRNIAERHRVLRECCRVLKPGGLIQIMEMAVPESGAVAALYGWYFDRIMPLVGNWLSRTDYAYSYLMHSVRDFPPPAAFVEELRAAGFRDARSVAITLGTARIYSARKPGAGEPG
jgi:demethylmenaquinone methyltransferase/2-methoxy-6-polyprenyl-1,4-benzoquinol methylase